MKLQKQIAALTALALLTCLAPAVPAHAEETASGTCGENLTWTLEDGTLTISGEGEMTDWNGNASVPWYSYANNKDFTSIVIEPGVTDIGKFAFYGCRYVETVSLPETVSAIGSDAFGSCTNLKSITIPEGVTVINKGTFTGCRAMGSVTLPESLLYIYEEAFSLCTSLTSVTIPRNVKGVGCRSFDGFRINNRASFPSCTQLQSIKVDPENTAYTSVDGVLYTKDMSTLVQYPGGRSGEYVFPDTVTHMAMKAFYGSLGLTSVSMPNPLTYQDPDMAKYGTSMDRMFDGCANLKNVVLPDTLTEIPEAMFYGCTSLKALTIPESVTKIGPIACSGCTSLQKIVIPESVTEIGQRAFEKCASLTSVTILNPDCEIYDWSNTFAANAYDSKAYDTEIVFDATIYGYEGSTAQAYAEKYERRFLTLEALEQAQQGDLDASGSVSVTDVVRMQRYLVNRTPLMSRQLALADLNQDGRVNVIDLTLLKQQLIR